MADKRSSTRRVLTAVGIYLVPLTVSFVAVLINPFSTPLMLLFLAVLILFPVWVFAVVVHVSRGKPPRNLASNPGELPLSAAKLRRLQPELFDKSGFGLAWDRLTGLQEGLVERLEEHLIYGDSQAAVVLSVHPLLMAAYTDEIDCIALLRFPDYLTEEYGLKPRSRLLTVNTYFRGLRLARDLELGPRANGRYTNFQPAIADFMTEDLNRIRKPQADHPRRRMGPGLATRSKVSAKAWSGRSRRPPHEESPAGLSPMSPGAATNIKIHKYLKINESRSARRSLSPMKNVQAFSLPSGTGKLGVFIVRLPGRVDKSQGAWSRWITFYTPT